jgi:2-desacetyl-2-hydroxyethyl bacteriochlorophyllide A dehydrogenase
MRAISCPEPGKLAIIDIAKPALKPGWVHLGIRHIGICGTDYHIFEGTHPFLQYPRIMGHELSGVVIDPNGSDFVAGDPVVINPYLNCGHCPACIEGKTNCCETLSVIGVHSDGGMTDEIVMPAGNLYRAEGLSLDQAAMVEFLAIGAHAIRRTEIKPGWRVLVVGSGPIGLGTAFFAKIAGSDVTVVDAAADKVAMTHDLGLRAFHVSELESNAFAAQKQSGFDAVLDATGSIQVMNSSIFHVRSGGSYTLVGVIKGDLVWPDAEVHRRELTIRASRNATKQDFDHVMESIRRGLVPTAKLATHRMDFADVVTELPRLTHERDGLIKAIINL